MNTPLAFGRLQNPDTSPATDPRINPSLIKAVLSLGPKAGNNAPTCPIDCNNATLEDMGQWIGTRAIIGENTIHLATEKFPIPPPLNNSAFPEATHETREITGVDGNVIPLYIHRPAKSTSNTKLPAIVYFHGGAMVMGNASSSICQRWMEYLAAYASVIVIGVEFRNAWTPKEHNPYPAGLNDCASAIKWAYKQKEDMGISKLIVSGESGGGNLALSSTIKAKQEGWIDHIDGVVSIVPYISGVYGRWSDEEKLNAGLASLLENNGYALDMASCGVFARYYASREHDTNPTVWPYHATQKELEGLPPIRIIANELDPLRDEAVEFYRKLLRAGVRATAKINVGLTHGADIIWGGAIPDHHYELISDIKVFAYAL